MITHRKERSFNWSEGALAEGLRCYRNEEFFLAHEYWETIWLQLDGQEKMFLQGLIQTTAAFHHVQRKNSVGAASLMRGALRRLDPLPPDFGGIAVDALRQSLSAWLRALEYAEPGAPIPFPQIRISPGDRS
ncbi:MAG: DUF309 domain-containing protein [Terracidiphilus sp.]